MSTEVGVDHAGIFEAAGEAPSDPTLEDWKSAPGYTIAVTDDVPGVMKGDKPVTAEPINVVETGEDDHGTCYVTLRWRRGASVRTFTAPREEVYGNGLLRLSGRGAPIHTGNRGAVQSFLQAQEQANTATIPQVRIFTPGWSRDRHGFVLGETLIGTEGRVVSKADPSFTEALRPRGDVDVYKELCTAARDSSPVAEMAWAAGYAAPLIRLLGLRSMVFSVWGPSGGGKSAIQALAVSPWGAPRGIKLTADISPAALEIILAVRNDFLLWIDDTQQSQTEKFLELLAYRVGNDTSAARATQDGGAREVRTWNSLTFVSGERPMHRKGAAAGAQNRSIEVFSEPLGKALAQRLHQELDEHHGHMGPRFIEALLEHVIRPGRIHELKAAYRELVGSLGPAGDPACGHVAVLVLADALARELVWGEDEDDAELAAKDAGKALLRAVRAEQEAVGTQFDDQHENLRSWVAQNEAAFRDHIGTRFGKFLPNEEKGHVVAILPTAFRSFTDAYDCNERAFLRCLKDRGLLLCEGKDYARKVQVKGVRERHYCIVLEPGQGTS